jgi:hypothetical protein
MTTQKHQLDLFGLAPEREFWEKINAISSSLKSIQGKVFSEIDLLKKEDEFKEMTMEILLENQILLENRLKAIEDRK